MKCKIEALLSKCDVCDATLDQEIPIHESPASISGHILVGANLEKADGLNDIPLPFQNVALLVKVNENTLMMDVVSCVCSHFSCKLANMDCDYARVESYYHEPYVHAVSAVNASSEIELCIDLYEVADFSDESVIDSESEGDVSA